MEKQNLQKKYPPLKLAIVGKSYQHEPIMDKGKNNVDGNDDFLKITWEPILPYNF